jgi:hypothetical protein
MHTSSQRISRKADDRAARRLLEYAYVISLGGFVKISDPSNMAHYHSEGQFDEAFADFVPLLGVLPSAYIRTHNRHQRVVARIDMLPGEAGRIIPLPDEYPLKVLNLASQIPVPVLTTEQLDDPFPRIFMNHLTYLFDHDQDKVHHVLRWLAHLVFKPETRINHGLMISGSQGTGKSFLGEVIKRLIGELSFLETNAEKLRGRFNDFIPGKRCLLVEEVTDSNGSGFYNSLKPKVTSPTLPIEAKGRPLFTIQNHTHWVLLSNSRKPLAIDKDDRRLFYIHSNAVAKDADYYDQLFGTLDDEVPKIYHFLRLNYLPSLPSNFATASPPKTEDHQQLALAAEDDLSVLLADELERGEGFFQAGVFFPWLDFTSHIEFLTKLNRMNSKDLKTKVLELGATHQRVTIEGRKVSVTWFPTGNEDLPALFKDNSKAGRGAVKARMYSGSSSHHGFDRAKDVL